MSKKLMHIDIDATSCGTSIHPWSSFCHIYIYIPSGVSPGILGYVFCAVLGSPEGAGPFFGGARNGDLFFGVRNFLAGGGASGRQVSSTSPWIWHFSLASLYWPVWPNVNWSIMSAIPCCNSYLRGDGSRCVWVLNVLLFDGCVVVDLVHGNPHKFHHRGASGVVSGCFIEFLDDQYQ